MKRSWPQAMAAVRALSTPRALTSKEERRCQRETAQTTSTEDASAASLPARCLLAIW